MSRFALLLVCGLLVASLTVNASVIPPLQFISTSKPAAKKSTKSVKDDPTPPAPNPPPSPPSPPVPPPVDNLPILELPAQIVGDIGSFIKVVAQTNGDHVRWVAMDKGLAVFPGEMLKDSTTTVVMSNTPGQYRLLAYTALNDIPSDPVQTMIVVNGPQPPPQPIPVPPPGPAPGPPPAPTPVPPAPTATKLWIVTIDDASHRDSRTAAVLTDMALWNGFTQAGHQWLKLNITDPQAAKFKQMMDANGGIPCVVIMDANKVQHNWLNQNPMDMKLPATSAGLQSLVSKFVGR